MSRRLSLCIVQRSSSMARQVRTRIRVGAIAHNAASTFEMTTGIPSCLVKRGSYASRILVEARAPESAIVLALASVAVIAATIYCIRGPSEVFGDSFGFVGRRGLCVLRGKQSSCY